MRGILAIGLPILVLCASTSARGEVVQARTEWSHTAARPGDQLVLAVIIDLERRWHIYADAAQQLTSPDGFLPVATELTVKTTPPGVEAGPVVYARPHEITDEFVGMRLRVYEGRTVFYVPVTVGSDVSTGTAEFELSLYYLACDDARCLMPTMVTVPARLAIVSPDSEVAAANADLFVDYENQKLNAAASVDRGSQLVGFDFFGAGFSLNASTMWGLSLLLLAAALGGLLLNFTPCVLPVIPIKIIGISQAAGHRGRCLALGVAMSCGVVALWLVLGGVIAFATGFTAANQLFQYPAFTIGVGVLIAVMAVGMCGVFAIRLPRFVYMINPKHDTLAGSFGFGIMTAVLSTPCTAPFMGSAAAWATTQSPGLTMVVFAAIGAGMALPYLVLSASPALVEKMPRSGPAGELIKQIMGLLMLAAAAYFIGVGVSALATDPPSLLYWWPVALLVAAAGAWLIWRAVRITPSIARQTVFVMVGVLSIAAALFAGVKLTDRGPIDWVYYTPQRFAAALADGKVVVMDFTAEWCLNCKALELGVLHTESVSKLLVQDDVVPMKVDFTKRKDPEANKMLLKVGRVQIPVLVVFAPDGSEVLNSHTYRAGEVVEAVATAKDRTTAHVGMTDVSIVQ